MAGKTQRNVKFDYKYVTAGTYTGAVNIFTVGVDYSGAFTWAEFRKQIAMIALQAPQPQDVAPARHRTILATKLRKLTREYVVNLGSVYVKVEADDC